MRKGMFLGLAVAVGMNSSCFAQDTFSIVAVDSITGEVGSAGASCVDLSSFPSLSDGFLGELFPGVGAVNTQAAYLEGNQENARERMELGDSPAEIIEWLVENDVSGDPTTRQYGIVRLIDGSPESAAHSGSATFDYSNHILGPNYSIQGNILLGAAVLDSMEARFLRADGDLACKLMAAMQGANMIGADSRCADNGTSSLFAFLKVAQMDDSFGDPSLLVSVCTADGEGIEPIDSLQNLFDVAHTCPSASISENGVGEEWFNLYPNPAIDMLTVSIKENVAYTIEILSVSGQLVAKFEGTGDQAIDVSTFKKGVYMVRVSSEEGTYTRQFTKQ